MVIHNTNSVKPDREHGEAEVRTKAKRLEVLQSESSREFSFDVTWSRKAKQRYFVRTFAATCTRGFERERNAGNANTSTKKQFTLGASRDLVLAQEF